MKLSLVIPSRFPINFVASCTIWIILVSLPPSRLFSLPQVAPLAQREQSNRDRVSLELVCELLNRESVHRLLISGHCAKVYKTRPHRLFLLVLIVSCFFLVAFVPAAEEAIRELNCGQVPDKKRENTNRVRDSKKKRERERILKRQRNQRRLTWCYRVTRSYSERGSR